MAKQVTFKPVILSEETRELCSHPEAIASDGVTESNLYFVPDYLISKHTDKQEGEIMLVDKTIQDQGHDIKVAIGKIDNLEQGQINLNAKVKQRIASMHDTFKGILADNVRLHEEQYDYTSAGLKDYKNLLKMQGLKIEAVLKKVRDLEKSNFSAIKELVVKTGEFHEAISKMSSRVQYLEKYCTMKIGLEDE